MILISLVNDLDRSPCWLPSGVDASSVSTVATREGGMVLPAAATPADSGGGGGASTGAIVGGAVGGVVVLLLALLRAFSAYSARQNPVA